MIADCGGFRCRDAVSFKNDLFADRHVLVTGGGTGIGYAIAHAFGGFGARVTIDVRTILTLDQATNEMVVDGIRANWCALNIRDADQVAALFETRAAEGALPDILVNNAGGQFGHPGSTTLPTGSGPS